MLLHVVAGFLLSATAAISAISALAEPRSPGRAIARALAVASLTIEIGPAHP